jgi:ribonuclease BN (tRNA processing enzyme)
VPAVGYQVTSAEGKVVFCTGDTGPGLGECWGQVSPQLLITEVTLPNEYEETAIQAGHLTPSLLKEEMTIFRELKGYLPQIVTVHMSPDLEYEIETQLGDVAEALDTPISLGYEGMLLSL